jgi:hypothetical protein
MVNGKWGMVNGESIGGKASAASEENSFSYAI